MSKLKLFLCLAVSFLFSSCDIYNAFKGNKEIVDFLNQNLNVWQSEEKLIFEKYNTLIAGESFSSKITWDELEKNMIPLALHLREEINRSDPKKESLMKIKRLFLEKMDLLLEGMDLIREGLKKEQEKDSIEMIYKGRDKFREVAKYNEMIENEVLALKKEYYIQDEKKDSR